MLTRTMSIQIVITMRTMAMLMMAMRMKAMRMMQLEMMLEVAEVVGAAMVVEMGAEIEKSYPLLPSPPHSKLLSTVEIKNRCSHQSFILSLNKAQLSCFFESV